MEALFDENHCLAAGWWQNENPRRQIDKLDKKLDLLINWQMTHNDRDPEIVEQGGWNPTRQGFGGRSLTGEAMQGGGLADPHDESFT